jgi:hypothetical protein
MEFDGIGLDGITFLCQEYKWSSDQSQGGHNNIIKLTLIKKVLNFVNHIRKIK